MPINEPVPASVGRKYEFADYDSDRCPGYNGLLGQIVKAAKLDIDRAAYRFVDGIKVARSQRDFICKVKALRMQGCMHSIELLSEGKCNSCAPQTYLAAFDGLYRWALFERNANELLAGIRVPAEILGAYSQAYQCILMERFECSVKGFNPGYSGDLMAEFARMSRGEPFQDDLYVDATARSSIPIKEPDLQRICGRFTKLAAGYLGLTKKAPLESKRYDLSDPEDALNLLTQIAAKTEPAALVVCDSDASQEYRVWSAAAKYVRMCAETHPAIYIPGIPMPAGSIAAGSLAQKIGGHPEQAAIKYSRVCEVSLAHAALLEFDQYFAFVWASGESSIVVATFALVYAKADTGSKMMDVLKCKSYARAVLSHCSAPHTTVGEAIAVLWKELSGIPGWAQMAIRHEFSLLLDR
jgi:hypothetical protein